MNEQDKREIMLEIAARYNGEWPDFATHIWLMPSGSEVFGHIDNDYLFDKETILCSKSEYEAFIDSLFEGAPYDAEYYHIGEHHVNYWKKLGEKYQGFTKVSGKHVAGSIHQLDTTELIPRPRKQEQEKAEWSGEGLPPVGTKCEIQTDDLSDFYQVTIQAYSNDGKVVLIYDDLDGNCEYDYWFIDDTIFRPLKTEPKNWTPKAGEPCEFDVGGGDWVYALPLFVGKTIVVFENDHGDECRATSVDRFRPVQPDPKPWIPEVGQECEYKYDFFFVDRQIGNCTPIAYHGGKVWIELSIDKTQHLIDVKKIDFRPIKTESEKEREELIELALSLDCHPQEGMLSRRDFVGAMLDAGWRPQKVAE